MFFDVEIFRCGHPDLWHPSGRVRTDMRPYGADPPGLCAAGQFPLRPSASLENSISYIAFALYTVKKIVQRLILGHSEGISVSDIFNTSLDSRKFFL